MTVVEPFHCKYGCRLITRLLPVVALIVMPFLSSRLFELFAESVTVTGLPLSTSVLSSTSVTLNGMPFCGTVSLTV